MKKLLALLLILLATPAMACCILSPAEQQYADKVENAFDAAFTEQGMGRHGTVCIAMPDDASNVNMRDSPSVHGKITNVIPSGTQVFPSGAKSGDWFWEQALTGYSHGDKLWGGGWIHKSQILCETRWPDASASQRPN